MTGERYLWLRLADRLKMSVQRCMHETTVSDFYDWCEYIRQVDEDAYQQHSKLDWQIASLTAEVRRSWVKEPRRVKPEAFLLKFKKRLPKPKTKEEAALQVKQAILGAFGIDWSKS